MDRKDSHTSPPVAVIDREMHSHGLEAIPLLHGPSLDALYGYSTQMRMLAC